MKYMVISDIHDDINNLNKVLSIYTKEYCNKLLVLGDLFNYGFDINREDIVNRLNLMADNIVAVRGNCDNNIVGIMFDMPYISNVIINNKNILLTHGHLYDDYYLLGRDADIILTGHSHVSSFKEINNRYLINPGSISKSRNGENSFVIIDENKISIRNLDNQILEEYNFNK